MFERSAERAAGVVDATTTIRVVWWDVGFGELAWFILKVSLASAVASIPLLLLLGFLLQRLSPWLAGQLLTP